MHLIREREESEIPMNTAEGYAYFVQNPRRIDDLFQPHLPEKEMPYVVAASVALSNLDYENFTQDMTVDRPILENYSWLCSMGPLWCCILVHKKDRREEGMLVIPKDKCFIGWAAYFHP